MARRTHKQVLIDKLQKLVDQGCKDEAKLKPLQLELRGIVASERAATQAALVPQFSAELKALTHAANEIRAAGGTEAPRIKARISWLSKRVQIS